MSNLTWPAFFSAKTKEGKTREEISAEWKALKADVPPRLSSGDDANESKAPESKPAEEDYLRKYEYHKKTGYPYFMISGYTYTSPDPSSKAGKMKQFLLSQPKVRIFVPRGFKESPKVLQTVNLNGYRLDFPKNTYLDLPLQVAEVLKNSLAQTEDALAQFRIDRDGFNDSALL